MWSLVECDGVYIKFQKIFREKFEIETDTLDNGLLDANLLGNRFRFAPRDLLCLYFYIEEEFGIKIPQEEIVAGRFDTMNNIMAMIKKQIGK